MRFRDLCALTMLPVLLATACAPSRRDTSGDTSNLLSEQSEMRARQMVQNLSPEQQARQAAMTAVFMELVASNDARNPILPDAELIAKFQSHRATFQKLRQMIAADPKLHRVDEDWTMPENPESAGVSAERIREYRTLLNQVGCPRGFGADHGKIDFISAAQGTVIAGRDQGFTYSEFTPEPLVTNTVEYRPLQRTNSWQAYRRIEESWYIYFEEN